MDTMVYDAAQPRPMRNYLGRLWSFRKLMVHLAMAQLRSRLRRSALGIVWIMLNPVIMALIFTLIFGRLFQADDIVSYAVYVLVGSVFFEIFSQSVNVSAGAFIDGQMYMKQARMPSAIFPIRTMIYLFICFLFALAGTFAIGFATGKFVVSVNLLYLLPGILLFLCMMLPMAIISAIANIKFGDFSQIAHYFMMIAYYMTPVFIPRELFDRPELFLIDVLSPILAMLDIARDTMMNGIAPSPRDFALMGAWSLVLWVIAVVWLRKEENKIVYYS